MCVETKQDCLETGVDGFVIGQRYCYTYTHLLMILLFSSPVAFFPMPLWLPQCHVLVFQALQFCYTLYRKQTLRLRGVVA